jgi:hypothetical protein
MIALVLEALLTLFMHRFKGEIHNVLLHSTPRGLQLSNMAATFVCLSDFVFHFR